MKTFIPPFAFLLVGISGTYAHAAVPTTYKGTPYGGAPRPIPGRIDLIDYDMGGLNVGFFTTHHGDVACAGVGYRTDAPTATLCKTSKATGQFNNVPDQYSAGPLMGTPYPSATTDDYYIGAIRPGDWVNVTVNVMAAGTYQISSTLTSAGGSIDMKISMNGALKNETKLPTTGGYHNWVPYPNYATVTLDAGVQVVQFQSVVEHLNFDYLQFSLVTPDGGIDPGNADGSVPAQTASDAGDDDATPDGPVGSGTSTGSSAATSGATSGDSSGMASGSNTGSSAASGSSGSGGAPSGARGGSQGGAAASTNAPGVAGCGCSTLGETRSAGGLALVVTMMGALVACMRKRPATTTASYWLE